MKKLRVFLVIAIVIVSLLLFSCGPASIASSGETVYNKIPEDMCYVNGIPQWISVVNSGASISLSYFNNDGKTVSLYTATFSSGWNTIILESADPSADQNNASRCDKNK